MDQHDQRPRSPRIPVEFALDVEGTDHAGKPFLTRAIATKISRGGATIIIDVDVPVGSQVTLTQASGGNKGFHRLHRKVLRYLRMAWLSLRQLK